MLKCNSLDKLLICYIKGPFKIDSGALLLTLYREIDILKSVMFLQVWLPARCPQESKRGYGAKAYKENLIMARTVGIGNQDFETVRRENYFYIDKSHFIREWWENGDIVTLITRPRRFGKTLNMSMLEKFFSVKYAGRGELFEGLSV